MKIQDRKNIDTILSGAGKRASFVMGCLSLSTSFGQVTLRTNRDGYSGDYQFFNMGDTTPHEIFVLPRDPECRAFKVLEDLLQPKSTDCATQFREIQRALIAERPKDPLRGKAGVTVPPTPLSGLTIRCPVSYCKAAKGRKCCDRRGICRSDEHRERKRKANE